MVPPFKITRLLVVIRPEPPKVPELLTVIVPFPLLVPLINIVPLAILPMPLYVFIPERMVVPVPNCCRIASTPVMLLVRVARSVWLKLITDVPPKLISGVMIVPARSDPPKDPKFKMLFEIPLLGLREFVGLREILPLTDKEPPLATVKSPVP